MVKRKVALKWLAGVLAVILVLAGCSKGNNSAGSSPASSSPTSSSSSIESSAAPSEKKVTLNMFVNRVESVEAFQKLKEIYEAKYPNVTLQVETQTGGEFGTALKAKFSAGAGPDIFTNAGFSDLDVWSEKLEDLSSETWQSDVLEHSLDGITKDGKVYGFPLSLEGYGFMYNKDLFAKAGITVIPTTFTELKNAVEKLKAAGIAPFIPTFGTWYVPGVFEANIPVAQQPDPDKFLADLKAGTTKVTDNQLFKDWLNLFELEFNNGNANPLSIDYSTMVIDFANGKGAMTLGCSCSQSLLDEANPNINVGIMPMPINDDAALNDKIFAQVSSYLVVNKDSEVKEEAKQFIQWLVSTDEGKQWYVKDFRYIPVVKGVEADAESLGLLGMGIKEYLDQGKALGYQYNKFPDGLSKEWGSILQKFVAGKINKDETLVEFQKAWDKLNK
ncbi:ABC transporter substrate-binding protein [Cohnella sp.]|uniref:ABC transporter substrate-binding protein n=1 Tax=Cohnella sp. TaxID=1883426 RepID=UPI0035626FA4